MISFDVLHFLNILSEIAMSILFCNLHDNKNELCNQIPLGFSSMISFFCLLISEQKDSLLALLFISTSLFSKVCLQLPLLSQGNSIEVLLCISFNFCLFLLFLHQLLCIKKKFSYEFYVGAFSSVITMFTSSLFEEYPVYYFVRAIIKSVPVLLLSFKVYLNKDFSKRVSLGLLFCAFADFILEYDFVGGLGMFLIGHLLYLFAFYSEFTSLAFSWGLPIFVYGFCFFTILQDKLGPLLIPVLVYISTITLMVWRALALPKEKYGMEIAIGALLFAFSDSLIAIDKFINPIQNARYAI